MRLALQKWNLKIKLTRKQKLLQNSAPHNEFLSISSTNPSTPFHRSQNELKKSPNCRATLISSLLQDPNVLTHGSIIARSTQCSQVSGTLWKIHCRRNNYQKGPWYGFFDITWWWLYPIPYEGCLFSTETFLETVRALLCLLWPSWFNLILSWSFESAWETIYLCRVPWPSVPVVSSAPRHFHGAYYDYQWTVYQK